MSKFVHANSRKGLKFLIFAENYLKLGWLVQILDWDSDLFYFILNWEMFKATFYNKAKVAWFAI